MKREALGAKAGGGMADYQNLVARGLEPKPGVQLADAEVKKVSEIAGSANGAIERVRDLTRMREKLTHDPTLFASPEFRASAKAAYRSAQAAYKDAAELGTWDKGTSELLDEMFGGDPASFGFLGAKYKAVEDSMISNRDKKLDGFGVRVRPQRQADAQRPPGWQDTSK
jgi:hypothetical protein